jgi:hypothetical protein
MDQTGVKGRVLVKSSIDGVIDSLVFISGFFILGFCFLANAPHMFFFNYEPLNAVFSRFNYFGMVVLLALLLAPWRDYSTLHQRPLFWWILFFIAVNIYHLINGRARIDFNLFYFLLFLSPAALMKRQKPLVLALCGAIGLNAIYGALGMLASRHGWSYGVFPVVPYMMNGATMVEAGFYPTFSPGLYYQTNAAGAIYASSFAFFLYQLLTRGTHARLSSVAIIFAGVGLILSRSLAPLLLTFVLTLWCVPGKYRRWVVYPALVYLVLVAVSRDGVLGLNMEYLFHKINSSASVKISLLIENLGLLASGSLWRLAFPVTPYNWETENSFIDMAFQYGMLPTLLFYGYCVKSFMLQNKGWYGLLLLAPLFLLLMQNSALPPPSAVIFGLALALYGKSGGMAMRRGGLHWYKLGARVHPPYLCTDGEGSGDPRLQAGLSYPCLPSVQNQAGLRSCCADANEIQSWQSRK